MGNSRVADKRVGSKRKGPRARAEEYIATRESLRDGEAERQQKRRQLQRKREEEARLLATTSENGEEGSELSSRELCGVVSEIVNFFMTKMQACSTASSRLKIMECFLEDERIRSFLPKYYPCKQDAMAQIEFLQNYQKELEAVKGVQSADKLARKAVLLDAAVSLDVPNIKAMSRILKVNPYNLRVASQRKSVRLDNTRFVLARRKKRPGMAEEMRDIVVKWWTEETRVSPNRKEIVQKWISPKTYEKHCTHYLLETQVRIFSPFLVHYV